MYYIILTKGNVMKLDKTKSIMAACEAITRRETPKRRPSGSKGSRGPKPKEFEEELGELGDAFEAGDNDKFKEIAMGILSDTTFKKALKFNTVQLEKMLGDGNYERALTFMFNMVLKGLGHGRI